MKSKKIKQKISLNKINNTNILERKRVNKNLNLFLNKKNVSRNNNIISMNIFDKTKYFLTKKDDKIKNIKLRNLTDDKYKNNRKRFKDNNKNVILLSEIKDRGDQTSKNKSSDNLPRNIKNKINFSIFQNEDIKQMNNPINPINRNHILIRNNSSDNDLNNTKKEKEMILNKKRFKKNIINNSNIFIKKSNHTSRNHSINSSTFPSDILKHQISKIVKDISKKYKNKINLYNNDSKSITKESSVFTIKKDRNKSIEYFAKRNKNKLLNLLNREGHLINFLKSMNIKTTHNFFKARRKPKNNFEMNNLLINSFGLNRTTRNEFSKQLYTLNENFFSAIKKMKKQKVEIDERNFNEKRNSNSSNLSVEIMKENEREWEKKFMENINKSKLSEYEFNEFKNIIKYKQNKNIIKHSKNFANKMMNLNMDEYESPNIYNFFKSSGNNISINNINRITNIDKLMKDVEEREQFNVIDLNLEQLKHIQKKTETDGILAIDRAGKPRFVKTKFKQSTIIKFKSVSGEFFGLPA